MLWFVNTDLTITTEQLVELFETMQDYHMDAPPGYRFQDWLDLPKSKVAEINRNYHSPSQRREAYLDLYATGHPCPSWRQVARALRLVLLPYEADMVEGIYVQGTRIILTHLLFVHYYHVQDMLLIYTSTTVFMLPLNASSLIPLKTNSFVDNVWCDNRIVAPY